MAEPQVRSYQQILGDEIDAFLARSGVADLRPGSVILSVLEASAQSDFRSSQDIFAVLTSLSLDRAEGVDLDKLANDQNVERFTSLPATGQVTFLDNGFSKIATKVYPGVAAPNIGSTVISVVDATSFPDTGSIYLGRGTPNVEGPLSYTSKTQVGSYWTLTLPVGTSKFHNLSESVILAQQGNRIVPAGTTVQTLQGDVASAVKFSTTISAIMPDGEDELERVSVVATSSGSIGNIPRNAIIEAPNPIFPNIGVQNPLPYVTGRDEETDAELKERVKDAIQARSKGTSLAIETEVIGIRATDEPKSILSAKVVEQTGLPTTLVIDDGTGYEELFTGIGQADVVDKALGGEQFLQLSHRAIQKAQLITTVEAPYAINGGEVLAIEVGGIRAEHTFQAEDFKSPGTTTAFEVSSSINGNSDLLFSATTLDGGTKIRVFAKADSSEDLLILVPIVGDDANTILQFNENRTYTLNLYKNDLLLFKDGVIPKVNSENQSDWGAGIAISETLIVNVDGTGDITYPIEDVDFVTANTGFSIMSPNNTLASWAAVLNMKIAGVTATVSGAQLVLESNKGANDNASLAIGDASTLVTKTMFTSTQGLSSQGRTSDYSFNKNTGQISLVSALVADDAITAGSKFTRGYIQTQEIVSGFVNLTADANFWFIVDGNATAVNIEVPAGGTLDVISIGDNIWRYAIDTIATAFGSVQVGDWFVVWDPNVTDTNNRGFWRITEVGIDAGDAYVEVEKSAGTVASYTLSSIGGAVGMAVARSTEPMQQITVPSGLSKALSTIVTDDINPQLIGASASVVGGDIVRITPFNYGTSGGSMIVTADVNGKELLFNEGDTAVNRVSHTAFVESTNSEVETPLFVHDTVATGDSTEPPVSIVSSINFEPYGVGPNDMLGFLKPLGATDRYSSNRNNHTQKDNIAGTALSLVSKDTLHEVIDGTLDDRIFPVVPYDLDGEDTLVTVIDQDAVNKTFSIPLARNIEVNNSVAPTSTIFNVYDTDRGPTEVLKTTFGDDFKFDDFKLWMKARTVLDASGSVNALVYRYADFGPNGEDCRVGYFYPTQPSNPISSTVTTGRFTSIKIFLPGDTARTLGHNALTEYDVTSGGTGPFTATYTWNLTGPTPDFVSNGVVVGDIVTIAGTGFDANNLGTFRITVVTAASITVTRPTAPSAELAIPLAVISNIQIYPLATTNTGQDIKDYVDANLTSFVETIATTEDPVATPNDLSGNINFSTLDDNSYRSKTVATAAGAVRAGNIVTISTTLIDGTTPDPHGFLVGDSVVLSSVTVGTLSFNGEWAIETVPSATTFTFTQIGADESQGSGITVDAGYQMLLDGENWIQNTDLLAPITLPTHLSLKKALKFSHTLYTLIGEAMKLIPTTADQSSRYMNTLGVTGITSVAGVTTSLHNDKLQVFSKILGSEGAVQVTGGTANSTAGSVLGSASIVDSIFTRVRTNASSKQGFHAGQFLKFQALSEQPKVIGFDSSTTLSIVLSAGTTFNVTITAGSGSFETPKTDSGDGTTVYQVEQQGNYFCIVHDSGTAPDFAAAGIQEGDWVLIDSNSLFVNANQGTFRVIRVFNDSIYFENSTGIEEVTTATAGSTPLKFFTYDSTRPGDKLRISSDVLGTANEGEFVVTAVTSSSVIQVNGGSTMVAVGATLLGADFETVQIIEDDPFEAIKRVHALAINPSDSSQLDIILEGTTLATKINATSGSSLSALNKYNFGTNVQLGIDGYKRHLGLVFEANRVVYGDPVNPTTFPGVKAAGAELNIQGPLIKRIQVSFSVRVRTGVPFNEIEEEIKNGVSAVVAQVSVGQSVVISDLITAVGAVDGVLSVSVVSPTFDSDNDLITVQSVEKPLIIDPDTDITVSQIGE